MFSHRLTVTEVMVVFDQGIEESLFGQSSHLPDDKLRQAAKIDLDGGLIEARAIRFLSPDQRIVRRTALGGKLDLAGPLQLQQERAADHIAQLTVGLDPVPCLTEPLGELSAAISRMLCDKALDEGDILIRNDSVSVLQLCVHTLANSSGGTGTQARSDLSGQFFEELHLPCRYLEVPDEGLQLMSVQMGTLGPVVKAAGGEALMSDPEALPVVGQDSQGGPLPAAKDKKRTIKGVLPEDLTADPAEAVDALAEINRLHTKEDAHLGSDLDHRR